MPSMRWIAWGSIGAIGLPELRPHSHRNLPSVRLSDTVCSRCVCICVFTQEMVSCANRLPKFSFEVNGDNVIPREIRVKIEFVSVSSQQHGSCAVLPHGTHMQCAWSNLHFKQKLTKNVYTPQTHRLRCEWGVIEWWGQVGRFKKTFKENQALFCVKPINYNIDLSTNESSISTDSYSLIVYYYSVQSYRNVNLIVCLVINIISII